MDTKITSRNEWIFSKFDRNIITNKDAWFKQIFLQMFNKTVKMFEYTNLPKTIPHKDLEIILQTNGSATVTEVNGDLYAFSSALGGKPNTYYLPTISVVANPALMFNKSLEIDKDCVVILNDYFYQGLMPLLNKYASLLLESEISLKFALFNCRIPAIFDADNDNTAKSAQDFFKKVEDGEQFGVVGSSEFFDGLRSHNFYTVPVIKDIIEAIQYIKGSSYNEIGLNAAFNMKREAINEAEATLNEDILYPMCDVMKECREIGLEKINKMYGSNIGVDFSSVWKQNRKQEKLMFDKEEAEIKEIESEVKDAEENK